MSEQKKLGDTCLVNNLIAESNKGQIRLSDFGFSIASDSAMPGSNTCFNRMSSFVCFFGEFKKFKIFFPVFSIRFFADRHLFKFCFVCRQEIQSKRFLFSWFVSTNTSLVYVVIKSIKS